MKLTGHATFWDLPLAAEVARRESRSAMLLAVQHKPRRIHDAGELGVHTGSGLPTDALCRLANLAFVESGHSMLLCPRLRRDNSFGQGVWRHRIGRRLSVHFTHADKLIHLAPRRSDWTTAQRPRTTGSPDHRITGMNPTDNRRLHDPETGRRRTNESTRLWTNGIFASPPL
jgi:hypothetical protein